MILWITPDMQFDAELHVAWDKLEAEADLAWEDILSDATERRGVDV